MAKASSNLAAAAQEGYDSVLQVAPFQLAGKSATEPEVVRWVARNIDSPDPDPGECPDPFAWTLLRQCRENPAFQLFFIEKLWVKLLPSRAQMDDPNDDGPIDGKPTMGLIQRIQGLRDSLNSFCDENSAPPASTSPVKPDAFPEYKDGEVAPL